MQRPARTGLLVVALLAGCAGTDGETPELDDDFDVYGDGEITGEAKGGDVCAGRWSPSADTMAAGARQAVSYEGASACTGGPQSGATELAAYMRSNFAGSVARTEIYNCRSVRGGSTTSLHGEGRAIDMYIPLDNSQINGANNALGDTVASWLIANAAQIGVQSLIWDRTIWTASRSPQFRCYSDPQKHDHNDHIHVELTWAGARKQTPFFGGASPVQAPSQDPGQQPVAPANPGSGRWIGDACSADAECDYARDGRSGTCFKDHGPADGVGFCTLDCAGFCPDASGRPSTFCASRAALGGFAESGACAIKSSPLNSSCAALPRRVELVVERFRGNSGAPAAQATVCAPEEALGWSDPAPQQPPANPVDPVDPVDPVPPPQDPPPQDPVPPPASPPPSPQPGAGGLLCDDSCGFANDGECDDTGPGATSSFCAYGTDCSDCGARQPGQPAGGGGGGGALCGHTCPWDGDGECDDGGAGAVTDACDYGTDCLDCGAR